MAILTQILQYSMLPVASFIALLLARRGDKKKALKQANIERDQKSGKHIFVVAVEDFEYDAEVIEKLLIEIGNPYRIYTQARDCIKNMPSEPCVYVLDDKLDQISGIQLFRLIVEKNSRNFVILNTGIQNNVVLAEYIEYGIDRFAYKGDIDHEKTLKKAIKDGIIIVANSE